MRALISVALCAWVLSACGSRPVQIEYEPDAAGGRGDWYPVPVEQTVTVTSADRVVERPPLRPQESRLSASAMDALSVTEGIDSFGNVSLEVNRSADLTWELLNSALERLDWPVSDRNRSEYRLELADPDRASKGFFARIRSFFSEKNEPVNLILVPKVNATGISAELADDTALSADENRRLMSQIQEALLQGQ